MALIDFEKAEENANILLLNSEIKNARAVGVVTTHLNNNLNATISDTFWNYLCLLLEKYGNKKRSSHHYESK